MFLSFMYTYTCNLPVRVVGRGWPGSGYELFITLSDSVKKKAKPNLNLSDRFIFIPSKDCI
jgi:hypothetical protein